MKVFAALIASFPLLAKNSHGHLNSPGTSTVDPNIVVRNGVLFQIRGCPQAITSAEAEARKRNESLNNSVIILESNGHGRSGNHFVDISQFLAMGYCCKSKVLELPAKDDRFPIKRGAFKSKNRFFDFSEANNVPLEEYATLAEKADICTPEINIGGGEGYNLIGFHPDLKACIERVYLRGCEALYLGDLVDVSKFCGAQDKVSKVETEPGLTNGNASCRNHVLHQEEVVEKESPTFKILDNSNGGLKAESLVLHMRSGDIFDRGYIKRSKAHGGFGQPPLEYYLKAISSQPWSKVSIITYSDKEGLLNPVFVALKDMATNGQLGPNVTLYQDRSLITDVQEMLCADALAVSRSSLHLLTTAFTRASTIFLPMECGSGNYTRGRHENKIAAENSTVLKLERPQTKVYGIEWNTSQGSYSAYVDWSNSKPQREEMLKSGTVKGLQQCCV